MIVDYLTKIVHYESVKVMIDTPELAEVIIRKTIFDQVTYLKL